MTASKSDHSFSSNSSSGQKSPKLDKLIFLLYHLFRAVSKSNEKINETGFEGTNLDDGVGDPAMEPDPVGQGNDGVDGHSQENP